MNDNNKPQKPYYDGQNESGCHFDGEFIALFAADHSVYPKERIWEAIDKYCEGPLMQAMAKWRALALLNQEYKSLVFRKHMLELASRQLTDDWQTVVNRMISVDEVAREMSKELIGREL
jgi:hypothetical protein